MAMKRSLLGAVLLMLAASITGAFAYAPDVPGWQQVNTGGFGDLDAVQVAALEVFGGNLYAGTENPTDGARIFRSADGTTWTPVTQPGFNIMHDHRPPAIISFEVYNGRLYAGTGWGDQRGQVWRTQDGTTWTPMEIAGFGDPDTKHVSALIAYDGALYAGAGNLVTGAQVWRSYSGDNNTWTQVAPATPGTGPARVTGMAVYGGALYAAVESSEGPAQVSITGGGAWTTVVSDGFASANEGTITTSTGGMAEFGGHLYLGAGGEVDGAQLWRTNDGENWEQTLPLGFGNSDAVESVFVFQNQLYISGKNAQSGLALWRSNDGLHWEQANQEGFGNANNSGTNRSNAVADFRGVLYLGTANPADGGGIWRMQQQMLNRLHLPLIRR
jgi:hypothetical protein